MRLFVGVELGDEVRQSAAAIAESLRADLGERIDARWVPSANLHITVWFLGEVDDSRARSIVAVLAAPFHQRSFEVEISQLGAFPLSGRPRVFWLGVTAGGDALARLHSELTARLEPLGFEPERRPYSAHLTIARVKNIVGPSSRDLRTMLRNRQADAGKCRIPAVTIFRSRVSSKGATYAALERVQLK